MPTAAPTGKFSLLVISGGAFTTFALPDAGEVSIGRGQDCDVCVADPSLSPKHVVLSIGPSVRLTSLADGGAVTRVGLDAVSPGEAREVGATDPLTLGAVVMMVQRRAEDPSRRIWSHGYFEARLEEECLRAERTHRPFVLVRVECSPADSDAAIEERLSRVLRPGDVIGAYGPGVRQILLRDTSEDDAERVVGRVQAALEDFAPRTSLAAHPKHGRTADMLIAHVGQELHDASPDAVPTSDGAMTRLKDLVRRVAQSSINVLIVGETGVGKEQMAQELHRLSPRAKKPFLGLNGAALSESLLESELFGHERGAFTGAVRTKEGLLEAAEGGTLFLDEVGEMPLSIQAKLLRVLETRQVLRVGGVKPLPIDVTFFAATNADLEAAVAQGRFRQDLYFRLNGVLLVIPPLRERTDEIPALVEKFVQDACKKFGRTSCPRVADDAMDLMLRYPWPGNIRELKNLVERAVVVADSDVIGLTHLPVEKMTTSFAKRALSIVPRPPAPPVSTRRSREELLTEIKFVERQRILEAIAACAGNQTRAAELMGLSRRTLVKRMTALGISGPRRRRTPG